MQRLGYIIAAIASIALLAASMTHKVPLNSMEAWGFVTGAWCVWLTVKQHISNWPIGIANCIFYIVVFWNSKLYADMSLQIVYVILGILGWYWWLHGGNNKTAIKVSHTPTITAIFTGCIVIVATNYMTQYLRHIHDSAPFLDAFTTCLSLAAQFLLTKKYIENWYIWIGADIIYIGLYIYKGLYLTAALYLIFTIMCYFGLRDWFESMRESQKDSTAPAKAYV